MEKNPNPVRKPMNEGRRNVVFGLAGAPIWIPAVGYEDLIAEVRSALYSSGPGEKELRYLEQKIRYYWLDRNNAIIAPADLILHVDAYVREVTTLLKRSLLPSMRTRLCACLGQGMLLIGVNFYDGGQFQTARAYFQTALESAHEANHNILQALAWGYDSFSWLYSNEADRDKHSRESRLKACGFASLESDLAVQCWTQACLAQVHAYHNEEDACIQALEQASGPDGYGPSDWYHIHHFDLSRVNGYRGICLQHFYRPDAPDTYSQIEDAKQALEEALSQPNVSVLRRAFLVVDMGQIHARKGDVESACGYARQIIGMADTNIPLRQRLLMVRTHLQSYADVQAVKDLDAEIRVFQLQ
jgi:tetratricopeptide (TPR) repeat protein